MTYPIPSPTDRAWAAAEAAHNEKLHWVVYATLIATHAENMLWAAAVAGVDPQTWMLEQIRAARVEAQAQFPINLAPFATDESVAA
jgi:hypothetical protein